MSDTAVFEPSEFGSRLALAIEDSGQSIPKLADRAGVSHKTIYDWRDGGVPRIDLLQALASVLGVGLDYLLFGGPRTPLSDPATETAEAELERMRRELEDVAARLNELATPS